MSRISNRMHADMLRSAVAFLLFSACACSDPVSEALERSMAEAAQAEYEKIAKSARIEPPPPMDSFQLSPMFQVPLADTDSTRTLILESSLGYPPEKPETGRAIERRHAELRDLLEKILRSKSSSDLDSVQGRLVLREEMAAAVNAALKNDGFVKEVYFSRFEVK